MAEKEDKKQPNVMKDAAKGFLEGLRFGSVADPDMTEEKVKETKQFTTTEVFNHLSGKEKLSDEEVEHLKRMAKHNRNL
ncbi:hypothetical protein D1B31_01560 [Neobacillus notoginsengisoli]|uniref:Uncharacterized protein n=1 Tax=Neobacillus notoginsengisoli TaxID=1578198 RepID=A0A417Z033_9BACI|nr:hypothetical protein [Neobacillus notoginsengisoli]RHW43376.1 hypothetical protein D1B31_01560 [Neobacillus notoginsengisoli]